MNQPLISVIIPTYNSEKTIGKCLDSILNQTLKNIEIIVVNDKSTDKTESILNRYKKNITLINNTENLGPSEARNKGLKIAKGKYISFIDSDDYIHSKMYEEMIKLFIDDVDLAVCSIYYVINGTLKERLYKSGMTDSREFLLDSHYVWDKLFKKDIIDKYKISFPSHLHYAEDFVFLMKYRYYSRKTYITDKKYYYHIFDKDDSICNSYNIKKLDNLKSLENVVDFYINNNAFEKYKDSFLDISINYYLNRIREFKNYNDSQIPKLITKEFLNYFKKYYENYKIKINTHRTKFYLPYRTNYYLMVLYITYKQWRFKLHVHNKKNSN